MSRAVVTLRTPGDRKQVAHWAEKAPAGTRVTFNAVKRTIDQNARLWAMLTDVATQLEWHGERLTTGEWKLLFLDALGREAKVVPGINGGIVSLGTSSSDLSKEEMSNLIDLIAAFGANHGVRFNDSEV